VRAEIQPLEGVGVELDTKARLVPTKFCARGLALHVELVFVCPNEVFAVDQADDIASGGIVAVIAAKLQTIIEPFVAVVAGYTVAGTNATTTTRTAPAGSAAAVSPF